MAYNIGKITVKTSELYKNIGDILYHKRNEIVHYNKAKLIKI